ncbi:MAG: hypothetical protein ACLP8A_07445 [Methylovirgula sp.]
MAQETADGGMQPPAHFPKQAVVVIHGIGEQVPMDTIKAFVRAAWETDTVITQNGMPDHAEVWSKPDLRTGSLELRPITTRQSTSKHWRPRGVRTDFYELYWADLSAGSTLGAIENWIFGLLFRNPCKEVPREVRGAWILLWLLSLGILYLLGAPMFKPTDSIFCFHPYGWESHLPSWFGTMLGAVLAYVANHYLIPYVGRVVRYTRATPENIAARKAIRERGLKLLAALHDDNYERIILVGHSLGSILAYDLINYFWADHATAYTIAESSAEFETFKRVEAALAAYRADSSDAKLDAFREAQRTYSSLLRRRVRPTKDDGSIDRAHDGRWLITDLVTLGSPLTHADFLLTSKLSDFKDRIATRDYSAAPPIPEVLDPENIAHARLANLPLRPASKPELLSFPFVPKDSQELHWQMHHAAVFAATTWTNIYDPSHFIFGGDFVSGSLKKLFGDGVEEINLAERRGRKSWGFTHTKYWWQPRDYDPATTPPAPHIVALREALNLAGQIRPL